jgi:hypothetical protein
MPGPSIRVRDDLGQQEVRLSSLCSCRRLFQRRADEGMAKQNDGASDRYQACLERGLQSIDRGFFFDVHARSAQDIADTQLLVQRRKQQRGLCASRQSRRLGRERALQPFRQPQAPYRALAAIGPLTPDRPRQLEQRERVA